MTAAPADLEPANGFLAPMLARAAAQPDREFGVFHDGAGWQRVSLAAMLERALQFTALLQGRALPAGSTVMLVLRHGLDAPACFVGTMLAGLVPSFLPCPSVKQDHSLYWSQHRTVLEFNRPPLVLTHDDLCADMLSHAAGAEVIGLSELAGQPAADVPQLLPASASVGLLQHSSGTTGMKKGVALSYGSIARQLAAYRDALAMEPEAARIVSWLPLYHDMGLISSFLLPLWLGVPIVSIDPFDWVARPELYFEGVETFGATHGWLPNFAFLHLARRVGRKRTYDLGSLRALISCSEPCKPAAFDAFAERFASWGVGAEKLQTCYAMAETVFAVSQSALGGAVRRLDVDPGCIAQLDQVRPPAQGGERLTLLSNGRPIAGCEVAILRGSDVLAAGRLGEIGIRADYMFSGYHLNPAASEAAFQDGWYRTGDIGFVDGGEVFVVGRIKDVIIVNGKNVFAHDVEQAVSTVAGVKPGRCVAFGRYSEKSGSELLVVVAERAAVDADLEADRLIQRDINRAVVEEVGVPCSDIRVVGAGWLVKTTSGKTSRSENSRKYLEAFVAKA